MAHLRNTAVRQSRCSIREASAIQPEDSSAFAEGLEADDQVAAGLHMPARGSGEDWR